MSNSCILKVIQEKESVLNITKKPSQVKYQERMERVKDFVLHNMDEELTLDRLSQVAGFSKFHFNRQFSLFFGVSTFRFIQLIRLKRASYQLAFNRETKVIDIALDAQFANHESFSRAFNKLIGQSPTDFRANPNWQSWKQKFDRPNKFINVENREKTSMEIKTIEFKTTKVAKLQHRGNPNRVLESAGKFIEWRKQTKLSPIKSSDTYGVAYDDPGSTAAADFRFDICGSIEGSIPSNPQGVVADEIPAGRCAVVRHLGSHDMMDDKIRYLYNEWLPASGEELRDFPCFFHYLNLIPEVEEHQLITDIYLPIK